MNESDKENRGQKKKGKKKAKTKANLFLSSSSTLIVQPRQLRQAFLESINHRHNHLLRKFLRVA